MTKENIVMHKNRSGSSGDATQGRSGGYGGNASRGLLIPNQGLAFLTTHYTYSVCPTCSYLCMGTHNPTIGVATVNVAGHMC